MNIKWFLTSALFLCFARSAFLNVFAQQTAPPVADYGNISLSFELNRGQADHNVQYLSHGQGYTLALKRGQVLLALRSSTAGSQPALLQIQLTGANANPAVEQLEPQTTRTNYFIGSDPAAWHTNIPSYGRIQYSGIYDGINLIYYGNQRQLEHDFIVAPAADPHKIIFTIQGATATTIDPKSGDLLLNTRAGTVHLLKPDTYQLREVNSVERHPIPSRYKLIGKNKVTFDIEAYDHTRPLIIDPVLNYSTYLSGSGGSANFGDKGNAIAVDSAGNAYIAGTTGSMDFPTTPGVYQPTKSGSPSLNLGFVTKLNPTGTAIIYSTYLGGSRTASSSTCGITGDSANGIAVDAAGNAYITGQAHTLDFPTTTGAFQTAGANICGSPFVTKLNPDGTALVYSTYLDATGAATIRDSGNAIAIDSPGNAYVTGSTESATFPTTSGAYQTVNHTVGNLLGIPTGTVFVSELNPTGTSLVFSTFLGGSIGEAAHAIALDASGNIYVAGGTESDDFPTTPGSFEPVQGEIYEQEGIGTGFVTKLHAGGSTLAYSTFLGGSSISNGSTVNSIAIDSSGHAYAAGTTTSGSFPVTSGSFITQATAPTLGFISKFNEAGSALMYSTYIGPTTNQGPIVGPGPYPGTDIQAIALDSNGNVWMTGNTASKAFPIVLSAFQWNNTGALANGGSNAFIAELIYTGTALHYASYLGGSDNTTGSAIAVNAINSAYVTGTTTSQDFPVSAGAFQTASISADQTAFVTHLAIPSVIGAPITQVFVSSSQTPQTRTLPVTFSAQAVVPRQPSTVPTGTLDFFIDGIPVATATLNSHGVATYTTSALSVGTHVVVADYLGDDNYDFSSAGVTQTIGQPRIAAINGGNQIGTYGAQFPIPFTVNVFQADNQPYANQTVTFSGPGLALSANTAVTDANGNAQITATPLTIGILNVTANVTGAAYPAGFGLDSKQAGLRVQPVHLDIPYGQPIPPLTAYTITGFVNGDTEASAVTGTPVITTTATNSSLPGEYPLTIASGTLKSTNYHLYMYDSYITIRKPSTK